jgi:hypothetical protein
MGYLVQWKIKNMLQILCRHLKVQGLMKKKWCGWQLLLSMMGSIQLCHSHLSQWSVFPPHPLYWLELKEKMEYLFYYKFILISLCSLLNNICSYTFRSIRNVKFKLKLCIWKELLKPCNLIRQNFRYLLSRFTLCRL